MSYSRINMLDLSASNNLSQTDKNSLFAVIRPQFFNFGGMAHRTIQMGMIRSQDFRDRNGHSLFTKLSAYFFNHVGRFKIQPVKPQGLSIQCTRHSTRLSRFTKIHSNFTYFDCVMSGKICKIKNLSVQGLHDRIHFCGLAKIGAHFGQVRFISTQVRKIEHFS